MQAIAELAETLLGLSAKADDLLLAQVAVRAFLVYSALIVFVRLGKKRFLAQATPLDAILLILIGSIASQRGERYSTILYFDYSVRLVDRPPFRFFVHFLPV